MPSQPAKSKYLVPRTCTRVDEHEEQPCSLESLRELDSYVLLGDPGIGKSESFRAEAEATGSIYQTARDFLTLSQSDLTGKTIFIDGLDENRASSSDGHTALDAIRRELDTHGRPRFRISCREADWFGAPDQTALKAITPGGELRVFTLNPLTKEDVVNILQHGPYELDGVKFIEEAEQRRLDELLFNPQTLDILAKAISNRWPATKCEAYELACEKMAREHNEHHKTSRRGQQAATLPSILDASGALSTILLITNLRGISLTDSSEEVGHIAARDVTLVDEKAAKAAIRSSLFTASAVGVFAPVHRTIAEYLAARFIARHIRSHGLAMTRVLALMCGDDGKPVTALRGLNAWLATLHAESRTLTIKQDPLGVILYGDPAKFTPDQKQRTLQELKSAFRENPSLRSGFGPSKPFGVLATPDMHTYLDTELQSPERDDPAQINVLALIDAIRSGAAAPSLKARLLSIVQDPTWWSSVRQNALKTYAQSASPSELHVLAQSIAAGKLRDSDDQLSGMLLQRLYPKTIKPTDVGQFLHSPQQPRTYGSFLYFWGYGLLAQTPDEGIVDLLKGLDQSLYLKERNQSPLNRIRLGRTIGKLVLRALDGGLYESHAQLYDWLGLLCRASAGDVEKADSEAIIAWLGSHPDDYAKLLRLAIESTDGSTEPSTKYGYAAQRFIDARWPPGMGLIWLEYADSEQSHPRMGWLFCRAMASLFEHGPDSGLSLEFVNQWVADRSRYSEHLREALFRPFDEWYLQRRERDIARKEKETADQAKRHIELRRHLPDLLDGTASFDLLDDIARLYLGHASFHRETPMMSLSHFLCDDEELIAAALNALRAVPLRSDIPPPAEILEIHGRDRRHLVQYPLLAGLRLLHENDCNALVSVPHQTLQSGIVFELIDGHGKDVQWRNELLDNNPTLVSETLEFYLGRMFACQAKHVFGLYELLNSQNYREIARHILPSLILGFPADSRPNQATNYLFGMLVTLSHLIDRQSFLSLVEEKLAQGSLRLTHQLCLFTAGLLQAPDEYLLRIRSFVADSGPRWRRLKGLLSDDDIWTRAFVESSGVLAWYLERSLPRAPLHALSVDDDEDGSVGRNYTESKNLRQLVIHLGNIPRQDAATAIAKLVELPLHEYWLKELRIAQANQRIAMRDHSFSRPNVSDVLQTLANLNPANARDLAALVLVNLDKLSERITDGGFDAYRMFWNVTPTGKVTTKKPENDCRDALFELLEPHFVNLGVDARRESSYAENKRADVRITFAISGQRAAVPVEVKHNTHKEVWEAATDQLERQYARDPESSGIGIYLVLWFGTKGMRRPPSGSPPRSAQEMQAMLETSLPDASKDRIFIRVIDCSGGGAGAKAKSKSARNIAPAKPQQAKADPGALKAKPKRTRAAAKKALARKSAAVGAKAKRTLGTKDAPASANTKKKPPGPTVAKKKPDAKNMSGKNPPAAKRAPAQAPTSAEKKPTKVSSAASKSPARKLPAVKKKAKASATPVKTTAASRRKNVKPARAQPRK